MKWSTCLWKFLTLNDNSHLLIHRQCIIGTVDADVESSVVCLRFLLCYWLTRVALSSKWNTLSRSLQILQKRGTSAVLNSYFMTSLSGFKELGRITITLCVLIYNNSPKNAESLDLHSCIKVLKTPACFCPGDHHQGVLHSNNFVQNIKWLII
jgi:hypothetical protein